MTATPTSLLTHLLCHIPKWERKLPKKYVVAASPSPKSLVVKVEIQTTDIAEISVKTGFWEINSVGLLCVEITYLGEVAIEDNPTNQSAKQLESVLKCMQIIVKSRVCFSISIT